MTKKWEIPRMFEGETVAVIATGPSATQDLVDSVRQHKRIAVRRAFERVPDADMLVALDGPSGSLDDAFWNDARDFAGMKVCGTEHEDIDALYPGLMYERVTLGEGHIVEIRNNGLAAIRIAARAGAAKILLLGFDTESYEAKHEFRGLTEGLAAITAELRAQGVEVERVSAPLESAPSFESRRRR